MAGRLQGSAGAREGASAKAVSQGTNHERLFPRLVVAGFLFQHGVERHGRRAIDLTRKQRRLVGEVRGGGVQRGCAELVDDSDILEAFTSILSLQDNNSSTHYREALRKIAISRNSFILENFIETGEIVQSTRKDSHGASMESDSSDLSVL